MKSLNRMVDIILMIAVFFLFPLFFFGLKQDSLTRTAVDMNTNDLVENVRSNGYIDREMYEVYINNLSKTGLTYQLSFERRLNVLEPEYRFRTPEEIIETQDEAYTGSNIYNYRPVTTEIPIVTDPVYTGSLNTETNSSVLASAVNTGASAGHTHTDECYMGHKHTDQPTSFTHYHKHADGYYEGTTKKYCYEYLSRTDNWGNCSSCGHLQNYMVITWYWNYSTNQQTFSWSYNSSTCDVCGRSWWANNSYTKQAYLYTCGYSKDLSGDGYTDKVDFSINYAYPGATTPQIPNDGYAYTYTDGCWSYHQHGYMNTTMYGNRWAMPPSSVIGNMQWKGASAFCILPDSMVLYYHANGWANTYGFGVQSARVNNKLMYSFSISLPDSALSVTSTNGTLTKMYLTPDELVTFCYGNFFKQIYEWTIDKSTPVAKACLLASGAYTGWAYDPYSGSRYAIYEEGMPILGYNSKYSFGSGSSSYEPVAYNQVSNCNLAYGWSNNCGKVGDSTVDCSAMVSSITPTHPIQTLYRNDPLITTIAVTHVDGSITTVVATTNFNTANLCQNQMATLTYSYIVDGISYTKSCTITVTVVPRNRTCANGHTYNLNTDGSDPGCPYCKAWLLSLTLITPDDGKLTIYRGTTLESNGVEIKAKYLNGHEEILTEGYSDNLDNDYIGSQTVTVGYKGKVVSIIVTVKRNLTKCTVCGRFYELFPDDSDPGCPYCAARTPIFTGNILHYKKEEYTHDILNELYDGDGIYYLSRGDFFKVTLTNSSRSSGGKMIAAIYKNMADETIRIEHSGIIRENGQ